MMNIQAEDSSIGNLYTTYYSNISSNQILRDVEMRIQGGKVSMGSLAEMQRTISPMQSLLTAPIKSK